MNMWNVICVLLTTALVSCSAEIGTYDYDNKIEENSPGDRDNLTSNVYVLPEQIFNDGKPFYVKKDPVSGTINFNAKTTPESLPPQSTIANVQTQTKSQSSQSNTNSSDNEMLANNGNRKHDISLDNTMRTQNFHDYLPVKYQSSKFVYPLVSSSYANLKYQGNNKNYISNHKYEASTVKSVTYVTKKPKTNYPTKAPMASSSSASVSASLKPLDSNEYETVTKPTISTTLTTRKYANIPSRATTPGRRYTTLSRPSSTTTVRNTNANYENKFNRFRSTTTSTTTQESSSPSYNKIPELSPSTVSSIATQFIPLNSANHFENHNQTTTPNDKGSMIFGGLFNDWFDYNNNNNEDSEEAESTAKPKTTQMVPASSTTQMTPSTISSTASMVASLSYENENGKISNGKYNITLDSTARKPYNRTTDPVKYNQSKIDFVSNQIVSHSTTAAPLIAEAGDKLQHVGQFRPPTNVNKIRVSPGAQGVAFVTNGQVSTALGNGIHSSQNVYPGQFQPPSHGSMTNIVVLPNSDSASFVASSQLQTANRFDQKRPIANANKIDETTKSGITFITKGQVTSAEAYDNVNMNKVNFRAPQANTANVAIASGAQAPTFFTPNQPNTVNGGNVQQNSTESKHDQPISPFENEIGLYGQGILSTQRPQGFILASTSTTAIPKAVSTVIAQSVKNEGEPNDHVRFPNENNGGTAAQLTGAPKIQHIDSSAQQPNNTIKFPTNQMPPQIPIMQQALPNEGLVSFNDGSIPNQNFVVFRPQPQIPMQPVMINMAPPQMIRNTPFVFKKPTFLHYPRKNFTTLPNILPQFRPSTQPQSISLEMANQIRQGQLNRPFLYGSQNMRYKTPVQFHYGQRSPIGAITIRPIDPSPNRRHFELHPGNFNQRFHDRTVLPLMMQRNVLNVNPLLVEPQRFEENLRITASNGNEAIKGADFDNADAQFLGQPMLDTKKENPKIEPVTTLQMIQQQRLMHKGQTQSIHGALPSVPSQLLLANPNATDSGGKTDKPLYLVYPMHKEMHRPNGEIQNDRIHRPSTIQQLGLPYGFEKTKSRYVLNSRPVLDAEKKSDQPDVVASNDNDEEDR